MLDWTAWIEEVKPLAFGEMELHPWTFYRMTPHEFFQCYDGYLARKSNTEELIATALANIMNACGHLKNPTNPQAIMGRPFRRDWDAAMKKKKEAAISGDPAEMTVEQRLAQKDAERRARIKERK